MLAIVKQRPFINGLRTATVEANDWEELRLCPICQRSEHLRDVGSIQGGDTLGTIASVCVDCEHGFLRRRPTREWYDRFYSSEWDTQGQKSVNSNEIRTWPLIERYNFCAPHLPPNSRVLDIGAGFGGLLQPFRDRGHSVYAIERSSHRAQYLKDVQRIPSFNSPIESFRPPELFNLLCMNHVLEHVSDPLEVVGILANMISAGGMIYIAVPDYWRAEYAPQSFHFVPHISWFTLKSLCRLLTRSGFQILKSEETIELQVLAVKTSGVAKRDAETGDTASRSAFLNRTLTGMLEAFGRSNGSHTLVWFTDDDQQAWYYRRQILPGVRPVATMLGSAIVLADSLPARIGGRIKRFLPDFVTTGSPRVLSVDLKGDRTLPITLQYPHQPAPVWVK